MKKNILGLGVLFLFLVFQPLELFAEKSEKDIMEVTSVAHEKEEAEVMMKRLNDIMDLDIPGLSGPEKERLRHEVLTMKEKFQQLNGIYISAGAVIVVLLLLLLLT